MADNAAPATATPAAPSTATTPAPASPPATSPEAKAPEANGDVKTIARALASERKANAMVADLKKQLEAATGTSTQAQQEAAILAEVKKNPRKLLDLGLTWDQIFNSISGQNEEPADPRHEATKAELKKLQERIDARDTAEADAKKKADKAAHDATVAAGNKKVADLIQAEGQTVDADGYPRWAIVTQDPAFHSEAIDAVTKHIDGDPGTEYSHADAMEMIRQACDQIEKRERAKAKVLLDAHAAKSVDVATDRTSPPKTSLRPQLTGTPPYDATKAPDNRPRVRSSNF